MWFESLLVFITLKKKTFLEFGMYYETNLEVSIKFPRSIGNCGLNLICIFLSDLVCIPSVLLKISSVDDTFDLRNIVNYCIFQLYFYFYDLSVKDIWSERFRRRLIWWVTFKGRWWSVNGRVLTWLTRCMSVNKRVSEW